MNFACGDKVSNELSNQQMCLAKVGKKSDDFCKALVKVRLLLENVSNQCHVVQWGNYGIFSTIAKPALDHRIGLG